MFFGGAYRLGADIGVFGVGGADQGEISLVGDGENDPPVFALKEIAFVVVIELWHHDVTAAHQTHPFGGVDPHGIANDVFDPGTASVYQHSRTHHTGFAILMGGQRDVPDAFFLFG